MYDPIQLHILRSYDQASLNPQPSFVPGYRFPNRTAENTFSYAHPDFQLHWQNFDARSAHFSLLEIHSRIPLAIPFSCKHPDLHQLFALSGSGSLEADSPNRVPPPLSLHEDHYRLLYSHLCEGRLCIDPGHFLLLDNILEDGWMLRSEQPEHSLVAGLLKHLEQKSPLCIVTDERPISPAMRAMLDHQHTLLPQPDMAMDVAFYQLKNAWICRFEVLNRQLRVSKDGPGETVMG